MKTLAAALTLCLTLVGCADSAAPKPDATVFTAANTATAKVEGMTCSSCEGTVCSAIEKIEGVQAVTADAKTGEVKIAIKPGATLDTEAIKSAVTAADFKIDTLTLPEPTPNVESQPKEDAAPEQAG